MSPFGKTWETPLDDVLGVFSDDSLAFVETDWGVFEALGVPKEASV